MEEPTPVHIDISEDEEMVVEHNYDATDEEDSNQCVDAGPDTEDEIERIQKKNQATEHKPPPINTDIYDQSTEEEFNVQNKSPVSQFFQGKVFYLSRHLGAIDEIKLKRFIDSYGGTSTKLSSEANYIISNKPKQLPDNFNGEVVRPLWVYECNDMELLLPTKRYKF